MKDTDTEFGTKVEMKNINAFTNVRAAIEDVYKRQALGQEGISAADKARLQAQKQALFQLLSYLH